MCHLLQQPRIVRRTSTAEIYLFGAASCSTYEHRLRSTFILLNEEPGEGVFLVNSTPSPGSSLSRTFVDLSRCL